MMHTGYDLGQDMRPWVSPSLIEANYILSLSRQELEEVISAEMDANPALDVDDRPTCAMCGGVLEGTFCPTCLISQKSMNENEESWEDFPEQANESASTHEDSDDFDPMTLVASDEDLHAQILADARTVLEPHEYPVAEYLVNGLDERGFLTTDLDELADLIGWELESVQAVLDVIQDVAPVGVGARDLRECLLLQTRYLGNTDQRVPPQVDRIIATHLTEFGAHKYGQIAKDLGLSTEEVEEARDFIRTHLNPFPLQAQSAKSWRSPNQATYVAPDVVISIKDGDLFCEVVDAKHFHLRISPMYDSLSADMGRRTKGGKGTGLSASLRKHQQGESLTDNIVASSPASAVAAAGGVGTATAEPPSPGTVITLPAPERPLAHAGLNVDDQNHVRQYSSRARLFISNIQQRRETLLKISLCLCELQESFLRGGVRELRPLTRAIVAQQVGVHESTVSRATANKYVMLPTRKVIPFSDFFTPSLSTKDVIKELIERETKAGQPLTDRRICDLLLQQGIRIARRTVAKYRAELRILPSTMR
jgi:DNA-directed RNA polymerase specialized sigma54-like protein